MDSSEKQDLLAERMERVGLKESDIVEKFILGSGSGGQKINKTSSCVYLKHLPTGLEVKCQKARSRELNRLYARRELCEKLEQRLFKEKSAKQQEMEKLGAKKDADPADLKRKCSQQRDIDQRLRDLDSPLQTDYKNLLFVYNTPPWNN